MNIKANAHITNNHKRYSLEHGYNQDGEFLGHVSSIDMVDGAKFDLMSRDGHYVAYDSATGNHTVYRDGELISTYANVYSQNSVILGSYKI